MFPKHCVPVQRKHLILKKSFAIKNVSFSIFVTSQHANSSMKECFKMSSFSHVCEIDFTTLIKIINLIPIRGL